jgi:hypothetical protein
MQETLEILQIVHKGRLIDTIEKYHIYKANSIGMKLNATHANNKNPIFEITHNHHLTRNQYNSNTPPIQVTHPTQRNINTLNSRTPNTPQYTPAKNSVHDK